MRFPIVTDATNKAGATAIVAVRMAIVSPPRPRRSAPTIPTIFEERRGRVPAVVAPLVTIVGIAVAMFVIYGPSFVNYDAQWAILWARDLWHGFTPEYTADFAPTPHPLATAVSSIALPFGNSAPMAILAITLLAFGALVYLTYRLGAELFSPWVGIVAALVVLTRPAIQRDALIGYQDIPFALLVVGAVLLEARRPRRGVAVLVLLALAGLLRPEAWVLGGLYWLYLWPQATGAQRAGTFALVLAAPAIWAVTDWIIAGDPLHSLHGTAALAEAADRRRSPEDVPYWTAKYFGYALREPMVIGVPLGLAFAWFHARRRAVLPFAVVVAMTAVFAIGPLFGLPLIRRYIETPAVLLTLFYGLAVAGWLSLPPGRARNRWMAVGVFAVLLSAIYVPWHATKLESVGRRVAHDGVMYADLQRVGEAKAVRAAFARCAPLTAADHRPIPFIRYWLGGPPGSVRTVEGGASSIGRMLLLPRRNRATHRVYSLKTFPIVKPPDGYTQIYRNASWRVFAAPGCAA
jgi:4-amino-4-deoxy-L-arabinose transferase-like glycosyltransferase